MKVALVGVGQAGGKVTEAIATFDYRMGFEAVRGGLAINTAQADLSNLELETLLVGQDRVKGHGVGGDNELGAEIFQENAEELMEAVGAQIPSDTEAIVVVAGLGGGTGSGGAPVLTRELRRVYDLPVYVLGILPGRSEGGIYQANAGRSLKTCIREADAVILIDNDAWRASEDSLEAGFERINDAIAQRVGLLFAAGEPVDGVAESVVDSSEVINTLAAGGVAALGYASTQSAEDPADNVATITSLTRSATLTGTSLPDAVDASAALLVVAGRPDRIARKGVERARRWVEDETGSMEVRGGDFPLESDKLAALVLLAGLEGSPRLDSFMDRAAEAAEGLADDDVDHVADVKSDDIDDLL